MLFGYIPVSRDFELLGALGIGQYDFTGSDKYQANVGYLYIGGEDKGAFDSLGIRIGVGAQYNITDHFALRAMARYVILNDDDYVKNLTEFSLGLRYMF